MSTKYAYVAVTNDLNQDQRMHRICSSLQKSGYQVCLIGREKTNSQKLYKHSFAQQRMRMIFEKGVCFYIEYHIRLFFVLLFCKSPSLLYSVDLDTALPVRLVSMLRNTKSIHDAHELFTQVPELAESAIKRSVWLGVGRLTMKGFDYRITVNDSLSEILENTYDCKFIVVRNLPNHKERSIKELDFQNPFIWYQGVLNEGRGLEEIIKAMSSLPYLDLRIAGEGDISEKLRAIAERSDARDRIHFQGWMDPSELHDWASNAWLGINLLNPKSKNYYHSLANRTFDFIQAELPALHMDFPEYRNVVQQYQIGELVSDLSNHSILKTIEKISLNVSYYENIKEHCRTAKKDLTWEFESKKLLDILA